MAEPGTKGDVEREALNYIRLGTLLQKPRAPERAEAVERVFSGNFPVGEKIRRIERIDAGLRPEVEVSGNAPELSPDGVGRKGASRTKESVLAAKRRRIRLKLDPASLSFLQFLFGELGRIKRLAKGNLLLKCGLVSVSLDVEAAHQMLENTKRSLIPPSGKAVSAAIEDGWKFLRKTEYNTLVVLKNALEELSRLDVASMAPRNPVFARRFFAFESAFLPFFAGTSMRETVFSAIDSALRKLSFPEQELKDAINALHRMLAPGGPPSCLQDLVLSVNMVRTKRFLAIGNLVWQGEGGALVSATEFDCPEDIQERIDGHVAELIDRLEKLVEKNEAIMNLRAFVVRKGDGEIEYGPLVRLYEPIDGTSSLYEKDQANVVVFGSHLSDRFLGVASPILVGRLTNLDGSVDRSFEYELSRLDVASAKLRRLAFELPGFPRERFTAIKAGALQPTRLEAEGVGLIAELAELLLKTAEHLASRLRSREAGALNSTLGAGAVLDSDPFVAGLNLREALSAIASAAYLGAIRFEEPTILDSLKEERRAEALKRTIVSEIERIADTETFLEARNMAGLAPAIDEEEAPAEEARAGQPDSAARTPG